MHISLEVDHNVLGASVEQIVEHGKSLSSRWYSRDEKTARGTLAVYKYLEDVAPVLPFVVQPLVEHLHDFDKITPTHTKLRYLD